MSKIFYQILKNIKNYQNNQISFRLWVHIYGRYTQHYSVASCQEMKKIYLYCSCYCQHCHEGIITYYVILLHCDNNHINIRAYKKYFFMFKPFDRVNFNDTLTFKRGNKIREFLSGKAKQSFWLAYLHIYEKDCLRT